MKHRKAPSPLRLRHVAVATCVGIAALATASVPYTLQSFPSISFPPDYPDFAGAYGAAINNFGVAVGHGSAYDSDGIEVVTRALRFSGGATTELGVLPSGFGSQALAINDNGLAVGFADGFAASFSGGVATNLGLLSGGSFSTAYGVNNNGLIVGDADNATGDQRAVTFQGGNATEITIAGANYSVAYDVNDSGQIVGSWATNASGSNRQGFVRTGNTTQSLGFLAGGSRSDAVAINSSGVVVGYGNTASGERAWLWNGGALTNLGVLAGFTFSRATDINDAGVVVGFVGAPGQQRAFVYQDGQMFNLNSLVDASASGWVLQEASGINNNGQIVGWGTFQGNVRPFVLTPVPEPGTLAALGLGAAALLRRRK